MTFNQLGVAQVNKTNLSQYVDPADKALWKQIVREEKDADPKRTVGNVFHDMIMAYKKVKECKAN